VALAEKRKRFRVSILIRRRLISQVPEARARSTTDNDYRQDEACRQQNRFEQPGQTAWAGKGDADGSRLAAVMIVAALGTLLRWLQASGRPIAKTAGRSRSSMREASVLIDDPGVTSFAMLTEKLPLEKSTVLWNAAH
jgi:hypothetical protein